MFHSSPLVRLMGMLGLLAVLGMLIVRSKDPATWQWLADERSAKHAAPPADAPHEPEKIPAPAAEPAEVPDTDLDPDQRNDAAEEFEAVVDGSLGVQPEDMFAYWRLFYWTEHQPFEALRSRAPHHVVFSDLMQRPQHHRGKLVALDLNVRRVLQYDVPDSPLGLTPIYEIWGWTDDSKAWLYCVLTAHLPEGMPVGPVVEDRARFVGYFLKLQGYYEAGAKPRAKPLRAPLLVGRLDRYPSLADHQPAAAGIDWCSLGVVGAGGLALGAMILGQLLLTRRAQRRAEVRQEHVRDMTLQWMRDGLPPAVSAEVSGERPPPSGVPAVDPLHAAAPGTEQEV